MDALQRSVLGRTSIPAADDARVALVSENADGGGIEGEKAACGGRQAQPARSQNAEDVTVGEQRGVPSGAGYPLNHETGAGGDLVDGFSARDAQGPEIPIGHLLANVGGGAPFVGSIIPFEEIGFNPCDVAI